MNCLKLNDTAFDVVDFTDCWIFDCDEFKIDDEIFAIMNCPKLNDAAFIDVDSTNCWVVECDEFEFDDKIFSFDVFLGCPELNCENVVSSDD